MNKIFTLFALVATINLSAQSGLFENFESYASDADLTSRCWTLSGAALMGANTINSTKSIQVIPTTSGNNGGNSNRAQITTPFINTTSGTTISLKFKFTNNFANNTQRTIASSFVSNSGVITASTAITYSDLIGGTEYTFNIAVPVTGVYKLLLEFTGGQGNGNNPMYVDDLSYSAGSFNYNAPYACSTYPIAVPPPVTLPIQLNSFIGVVVNNKVKLEWSVDENETGNFFQVEKSTDSKNFKSASLIFTTNAVGKEEYKYEEAYTVPVYYRLKIVNKDNSVEYSKTVALKLTDKTENNEITLLQNPIQNNLVRFTFQSTKDEAAQVVLYNINGISVFSTMIKTNKGLNLIQLNIPSTLSSGQYLLELRSSTQRRPIKVVK